jgi:hypothetical protein
MSDDRLTAAASSLAMTIHRETREEPARADAKASTLFAGSAVFSGVVLAAAFAGDWTPATWHFRQNSARGGAVGGIYAAMLSIGLAIYPVLSRRSLSVPVFSVKPVVRWRVGLVGGVGRVRADAQPYLGPRSGVAPERRHDG